MAKRKTPPNGQTSYPVLDMPGHLLRRCHQISVAIFLDECQAFDLTPLQYVALETLAAYGPLDKARIGGISALDRTTVSVVVKNLQERGFVTTRPSKEDRRATLIEITAQGRRLLSSVQRQVANAQERTVSPLSPSERVQLMRLLRKIADENNLLSRAPRRAPRFSAV